MYTSNYQDRRQPYYPWKKFPIQKGIPPVQTTSIIKFRTVIFIYKTVTSNTEIYSTGIVIYYRSTISLKELYIR